MTNSNAKLYRVLKAPVYSEKSQRLGDRLGVQVFKVDTNATKDQIRRAVELMFDGVQVVRVNTLVVKGKTKRFGKVVGKRSDYKKAYVTLRGSEGALLPEANADEGSATTDATE